MADFEANFILNNDQTIDAVYSVENTEIEADFRIYAAGTTWGNISGDIANQTDLKNVLDTLSGQIDSNHGAITELATTIQGYGDVVTYNAADFATAAQGALADSALQPGDYVSQLVNDAGYITASSLPTVNNSRITIQKNGTDISSFTLNQPNGATINISVPTDTNQLTNGAGYITSADLPTIEDLTTTAQLAAINSGATITNIGQIATNTQAISTETANRQNADNDLQSQIDALIVSSDVFDVVGTYAELQAYNISIVPVNDIIKVLVDSTHDNAATYYRCVETGGVKSWSYIGAEGAYYTKAEADAKFVEQTRTINGKPLSNNITLTASDVGALSTITSSDVITALGYTPVNKAGDTLSGNLTISKNNPLFSIKDTSLDATVNPDTNKYTTIARVQDVNNTVVSDIVYNTNTDGSHRLYLQSRKSAAESNVYATLSIGFDANGNAYTSAPNPAANSNNTNIATTSWVRGYSADKTLSNVTSIDANSAVYTALAAKQDTLVSGTNIKTINNDSLLGSGNLNLVTTDTAQDISGRKTFLGEKAIYFKQSATSNKLGFTLYNPSSTELGAFEYRPNTISGGALLNVNVPYSSSDYVGFRYWGTAVNIIAPKVSTAGSYYIPTHITNGTTTVTANNTGTVNVSSLLSDFVTNSSLATTLSDYATQSWVGQQGFLNKSGDTMSGTLTIDKANSTLLNLKGTSTTVLGVYNNVDYSTATSSGTCYSDIVFHDYTNTRRNTIRSHYTYDNTGTLTQSKIIIGTNKFDGSAPQGLNIVYDGANGYIQSDFTPAATNSTTSTRIPTCGWVNDATKSTNVVHRTNSETIAGAKTFTDDITINKSNPNFIIKDSRIDFTTNPSSNIFSVFSALKDVNDVSVGEIWHEYRTDGSHAIYLQSRKSATDNTTYSILKAGWKANGNRYCEFPNTTCVDGQWVASVSTLASGATLPTTDNITYDLSNYLPADANTYQYEVMLSGVIYTGATSGNQSILRVGGEVNGLVCQAIARSNASYRAAGSITVATPASYSNIIRVFADSNNTGTFNLSVRGYRRLGTNS